MSALASSIADVIDLKITDNPRRSASLVFDQQVAQAIDVVLGAGIIDHKRGLPTDVIDRLHQDARPSIGGTA
jgi:hypothetical protein